MRDCRLVSLQALAVAAGFAAPFGLYWAANGIVDIQVRASLGATDGLVVGSVHTDLMTGRMEISNIAETAGDTKVRIGRIDLASGQRLRLPTLLGPAFAQTTPVVVQDISIHTPRLDYSIPRLEATGTSLTAADINALVDMSTPTPLKERLAKLTAASIAMPDVVGTEGTGPDAMTINYHDVKLSAVDHGKVGKASIASIDASSGSAKDVTVNFGAISASDIDFVQMVHVVGEQRTDESEKKALVIGALSVDSLTVHNKDNADVSTGAMKLANVAARPFLPATQAVAQAAPKQADNDAAPAADASTPGASTSATITTFNRINEALGDLSFDALSVEALSVAGLGDDDTALKLQHFELDGLGASRLGSAGVTGLDFSKDHGRIRAGALGVVGLDFSSPLAAYKAAIAADPTTTADEIEPRLVFPNPSNVMVQNLDVDVPDAGDRRVQFKLAGLLGSFGNFMNGIPADLHLAVDHFVFTLPRNPDPSLRPFVGMGYRELDMGGAIDVTWNSAQQRIKVDQVALTIAGVAGVKLSGTIANVSKDLFDADHAKILGAFLRANVANIDVRVSNDGVLDKIVQAQAGDMRIPPAQLGHAISLGATLGAAVGQFLSNPKSLHVSVKANGGIGAADFMRARDPFGLLSKLEITAEANGASGQAAAPAPAQQTTQVQATVQAQAPVQAQTQVQGQTQHAQLGAPIAPVPGTGVPPRAAPTPAIAPSAIAPSAVAAAPRYFYAAAGQPIGPLALQDLAAKVANGDVAAGTLVWKEGTPTWAVARDLPEIAALINGSFDFHSFLVGTWRVGAAPGGLGLVATLKPDGSMSGVFSSPAGNGFVAPVSIAVAGTWNVETMPNQRANLTVVMLAAGADPKTRAASHATLEIVDHNTLRDVQDGTLTTRVLQ